MAKKMRLGELAAGLALGALPLLTYAAWQQRPAGLLVLLTLTVVKTTLTSYFQR